MKKYWFISYARTFDGHTPTLCNQLIQEHPFSWLIKNNESEEGFSWIYTLLSYQEITEEEYKQYNNEFNNY